VYNFASAVFFRHSRLHCKKLVIHLRFIYDLSLATTFSYLSGSVEKTAHLLRRSTYRFNCWLLHKNVSAGQLGRVPLIETNDSQRQQCLKNTAVGYDFPFQCFQICFDRPCDMKSSIVMLENYFVVSLLVLRPFFSMFGSNASIPKLIPILCNGFISLEQQIVHDIMLIPPNTEHKLGAMDIRFCNILDVDAWPGLPLNLFRFGLT